MEHFNCSLSRPRLISSFGSPTWPSVPLRNSEDNAQVMSIYSALTVNAWSPLAKLNPQEKSEDVFSLDATASRTSWRYQASGGGNILMSAEKRTMQSKYARKKGKIIRSLVLDHRWEIDHCCGIDVDDSQYIYILTPERSWADWLFLSPDGFSFTFICELFLSSSPRISFLSEFYSFLFFFLWKIMLMVLREIQLS